MAHVRKRQFQPSSQPSIKSFFTSSGTNSVPSSAPPATTSATSSAALSGNIDDYARPLKPTVPDHVQSLLINVGMRIRKSVPEGYKTHKSLPVPTMTYMHPSSLPSHSDIPSSSAPELYSKPSELAPFCGLHKIGGMSSQPSSAPGLSYSQSSIASSVSTPQTPQANTRKRSYAEDMDAELDTFFDDNQDQHDSMLDDTTSPIKPKYPLSHSTMPDLSAKSGIVGAQSRPKARMKMRSPHKLVKDFSDEDVAFLQPMDCE
jgi:hypothetical protein